MSVLKNIDVETAYLDAFFKQHYTVHKLFFVKVKICISDKKKSEVG